MLFNKKLIINKKINNFIINKKLFSLIFLVKLFYLFNECFLKDFKNYFISFYFIRFDFLLFNFFINNLNSFINNLQFYFYCLYFNFYNNNFLYLFNSLKINFTSLKFLDYKVIVLNELRYKKLNFTFLFKILDYFLFSFFDFNIKCDYISFIFMRSYFAYYRAFKFNEYLFSFFSLNNLFYLLKFFKISYWSIKKIQKYFPLRLRRVYREALLYYRFLVFQFYFKDLNLNYVNFPIISNNFIRSTGFIFFLILFLSLNILFLYFFSYFYFYISSFIIYISYLSQVRSDFYIFIFYYFSRFDFFNIEDIFFEFFVYFFAHIGFFYSFFFKYIRSYFLIDIFNNSLTNNFLVINNFLDYKNYTSTFFLNLNRFFYRMNYLFFLNYVSIFFFDHFWDLDISYYHSAFKWVADWCVYYILRFVQVSNFHARQNSLNYLLNLKNMVDFIFWNIFNIESYYSFQYFFMDLKYFMKKLDIDNLISYDIYRIGSFIDIIFNNISNKYLDFIFIVKAYFIYFFFRDFFFKLFESFKLFIYLKNNLIYSFIIIYWRWYHRNIFLFDFRQINCLNILLHFHSNFLFDYGFYIY